MKVGVLGIGEVGSTMARKLVALGHEVMLGARDPAGAKAQAAAKATGAAVGTPAEAAAHGAWLVNALPGEAAIAVLERCQVDGKILVDIANYNTAVDQPIAVPLGQAIQAAFPGTRVVKTLNSVSAHLMVDPASLGATHHVFIAGNDAAAKQEVAVLLETFGWRDILDLGDLSACRAMEQLIPLWMRLEVHFGDANFNLAVARGPTPA